VSDGLATAAAAKKVVVGLGGGFMISTEAKNAAKAGGYRGWSLYVTGRAGVLGDVGTEVVEAALGFHHPDLVRRGWSGGRQVAALPDTVATYVEVCRDWSRRHYTGLAGVDRLAELLEQVVTAAEPAGWLMFAAWRAQPLPDDGPARAGQLLHVLREHRGDAHLGAVRASGLRPVEAVVAGGGGPRNATFFGWPEPLPEVTGQTRACLARAEEATDRQVAPAYGVLDAGSADELLRLLGELAAIAGDAAPLDVSPWA
jgi:hypothetical protein